MKKDEINKKNTKMIPHSSKNNDLVNHWIRGK